MAKKKELFLEEAVLDDLAIGFDALEMPLSRRVFQVIGLAALCLVSIAAGRVIYLGWSAGDFYRHRAVLNASEVTAIEPERGVILDRYGTPLTRNTPVFRLALHLADILKDVRGAEETFAKIESIMRLPQGYFDGIVADIDLERQNLLLLPTPLTVEQVLAFKDAGFAGVEVKNDFERQYPNGDVFAHVLGYMGQVSKSDRVNNPALGLNESIGKAGLEAYYDAQLRGINGEVIQHRNARGDLLGGQMTVKSTPGDAVYTTIDADLQSYFYSRLTAQLRSVGSTAGVGIVLNPQNGEVLSLVSAPSFSNDHIDPRLLTDPENPLFNRAIAGRYSPGSTIKPLVALAALREGVIQPSDEIYSRGYIEVPNPYKPDTPSRFVDWKAHGWVNVEAALARSSNVYFYAMGGGLPKNEWGIFRGSRVPTGLGIDRLHSYWEKFGLGNKSGIDLPGEGKGLLPTPALKDAKGDLWRIGDTYNVSIGQGDLLVTPLELINYIASIANGGTLYRPFLTKKVVDAAGNVVLQETPQPLATYASDFGAMMQVVQQGMRDGVEKPYGTSYALHDLPFPVAAKTGTAQIQNNQKVDAFFVGYAPADHPQIAILVLIQNAREGSLNAVPVAKDVFQWYYMHRMQNAQGKTQ